MTSECWFKLKVLFVKKKNFERSSLKNVSFYWLQEFVYESEPKELRLYESCFNRRSALCKLRILSVWTFYLQFFYFISFLITFNKTFFDLVAQNIASP